MVAAAGHERDGGTVPASWRAVAAPMPLLAPVTRAAVPASFGSMGCCPVLWKYGVGAGGRGVTPGERGFCPCPCRCLRGSGFA
jgi:hypothetical protein